MYKEALTQLINFPSSSDCFTVILVHLCPRIIIWNKNFSTKRYFVCVCGLNDELYRFAYMDRRLNHFLVQR